MKKRLSLTVIISLALSIAVLFPACSSAPATPTSALAPATSPTPTPTPPLTTVTSPITSSTPVPNLTPTPTPSPSPTPTTSTATPAPTPTLTPTPTYAGVTFQTLANAGQPFYSNTCAVCHGADGGGSQVCPVTIWGSGSSLGTYNGVTLFSNAQGMLNYMSTKMPLTAPGSLSSQQYKDLLAFILTKADKVSPSTIFDQGKLNTISIP